MGFQGQRVIPAIRSMKAFERFIESPMTYGIFLELHIGQLCNVCQLAATHDKKLLVHLDLIQGLKSDEYAVDFISQEAKPYGIISTRGNVIIKAKQKKLFAIQRMFLLDSHAFEKNISLLKKTSPNYVEVLPGIIPSVIHETSIRTEIPILAGGFITSEKEIEEAIRAGATAVTTSKVDLWNYNFLKR
ncbi:glycerol-3-phosphate responsive antiterminator [Fredinandcohnia humi]